MKSLNSAELATILERQSNIVMEWYGVGKSTLSAEEKAEVGVAHKKWLDAFRTADRVAAEQEYHLILRRLADKK